MATEGKGIENLIKEIDRLEGKKKQEIRNSKKKRLISWMLRDIINEKLYNAVTQSIQASEFEGFVERIYKREVDPYTIADEIVQRLKKG